MVVVGGGGHAKVLLNVLTRLPTVSVLGYVDPKDRGPILGFRWLGNDDQLHRLAQEHPGATVAIGIGQVKGGNSRNALFEKLVGAGFVLPPIIAPTAVIARDVSIGEGSVIFDGVVIQPGCRIGKICIVNTQASLDHDCVLDDNVHIAPGAVLSGCVHVGTGSLVGVGACCKHGVRIGTSCTMGAGAVVVSDCLEPGTYLGVPARLVRQ
jgi:sugar O-acyltransferase (sialic acid O-acetyltransferase NeuD family)